MEIKLTESEVRRRLDAGEDPVALTIEHWMENAAYFLVHGDMPKGFSHWTRCALCIAYGTHDGTHDGMACGEGKCPLYNIQRGSCMSKNTPYKEAIYYPSFEAAMAVVQALRRCQGTKKPRFYIGCGDGDTRLHLETCEGDPISLVAANNPSGAECYILHIRQNGTVCRAKDVHESIGFQLDSEGRVIVR